MAATREAKLTPTDNYPTQTSIVQHETEATLLKHLPEGDEAPILNKSAHMQFLVKQLVQGFPARYSSQDASQPWLLFWLLQSFSCLGVVLDPGNKQRCVPLAQNPLHSGHGTRVSSLI